MRHVVVDEVVCLGIGIVDAVPNYGPVERWGKTPVRIPFRKLDLLTGGSRRVPECFRP
jgi:hypothetical protein